MAALATEVRLQLICAWCKAIIRKGDDPSSKVVSHGICRSCANVNFPERSQTVEAGT